MRSGPHERPGNKQLLIALVTDQRNEALESGRRVGSVRLDVHGEIRYGEESGHVIGVDPGDVAQLVAHTGVSIDLAGVLS